MTLLIPAKVLLHVWSYDFYDMTLSTGKQRRHMINDFLKRSFNVHTQQALQNGSHMGKIRQKMPR